MLMAGLVVGLLAIPALKAKGQQDSVCVAAIARYDTAKTAYQATPTPVLKLAVDNARVSMFRCVDVADSTRFAIPLGHVELEGSRLTKGFFGIPEYHDEGRLPTVGNQLGPMAHIYASPYLGTFARRQQIYEQGMPGMLAAIVVVDLVPGDTLPDTYKKNLRLDAGVNCVWLYLADTMPGTRYKAYVSTAAPSSPCDRNATKRGPLQVVAVRHPAFTSSSDYPPVARFDVDVSGNLPVMAFKCLAAFCEVGPANPASVRAPWGLSRPDHNKAEWDVPAFLPVSQAERRTRVIKGWHDEQYLSVRFNDRWIRLNLRATLTPVPALDTLDASDFLNTWTRVATLTLQDNVQATSKYGKWGLTSGANEIWMQVAGNVWSVQIRRGGTVVKTWIHVGRMLHFDAAVPPTARFRWTLMDDGIWVPCGNACCNSDGGGTSF
jgi:hypothetical protein